jgi:hypothetical protein
MSKRQPVVGRAPRAGRRSLARRRDPGPDVLIDIDMAADLAAMSLCAS